MTTKPGRAVGVSWLVAVVAVAGTMSALLVMTSDLGGTAATLARGVGGIETLVRTNGAALDSAGAIAPTSTAVDRAGAEVGALAESIGRGIGALDRMSADLALLSSSLGKSNPPLAGVLADVARSGTGTAGAEASVGRTAALLAQADQTVRELGPLLDETVARSTSIDRKLRALRLIPVP